MPTIVEDSPPFPVRGTPGGYRDPWDSDYVARAHAEQQRVRDAIQLHPETPLVPPRKAGRPPCEA